MARIPLYPDEAAFPRDAVKSLGMNESREIVLPTQWGLTKREFFAAVAMHAEFLSCGSHQESAEALNDAARIAGQSVEERMAINALGVADAMLRELSKSKV